jgi:hypothetical protein
MRIVRVESDLDWERVRAFVLAQTGFEHKAKPAGSVYMILRNGELVATCEYRDQPMIDLVFDKASPFDTMKDAFFQIQAAMDMCGRKPVVVVTQDCVVQGVASRYLDPMPGIKALMKLKEASNG